MTNTNTYGGQMNHPYRNTPAGIWLDGRIQKPITNFQAKIEADIIKTDGITQSRYCQLLVCWGDEQQLLTISVDEFNKMQWPMTHLGTELVVFPGMANHARTAIQLLSQDREQVIVYQHTGWAIHRGQYVFMHAGGGLGSDGPVDGVEVELPDPLKLIEFPMVEQTDVGLIEKVIRAVTDVGPDELTLPMLAAVFRSILGHNDAALTVHGLTGSFKSTFSSYIQAFFGSRFTPRSLPGSWSSTGNALENGAFGAKDVLYTVDDFKPLGDAMHRAADQLVRGQANGHGRDRLDGSLQMRPQKYARGLVLITGEELPRGHSLQARMLSIAMKRDQVNMKAMDHLSDLASRGDLAKVTAGYIQWLAAHSDRLSDLSSGIATLRNDFVDGGHPRIAHVLANFQLGMDTFADYAVECGGLTVQAANELRDRCRQALKSLARQQSENLDEFDPVAKAFDLMRTALQTGRAHILRLDGAVPEKMASQLGWQIGCGLAKPMGKMIGWIDGDNLYLRAPVAYEIIMEMNTRYGRPLSLTRRMLWEAIDQKGLLHSKSRNRGYMTRISFDRQQHDVLHLAADHLRDPLDDDCAGSEAA